MIAKGIDNQPIEVECGDFVRFHCWTYGGFLTGTVKMILDPIRGKKMIPGIVTESGRENILEYVDNISIIFKGNKEEADIRRIENRKRCLQCKYYGHNVCPLLANADVFGIYKCILEYDAIKEIKENSLDSFIFSSNPKEYLSYLGYKEQENYPKPGDTVLALTGGFNSSDSGKFLYVNSENDIQIFLSEEPDDTEKYCVSKAEWWKKLFKIEPINQ